MPTADTLIVLLSVMTITNLDSPSHLADALIGLFPAFANDLHGEEITTYHEVLQRLAPRIAEFLHSSSERTVKEFSALVNSMFSNGGDQENAVSTCLLEHASQIGIRKIVRSHLSNEARRELR